MGFLAVVAAAVGSLLVSAGAKLPLKWDHIWLGFVFFECSVEAVGNDGKGHGFCHEEAPSDFRRRSTANGIFAVGISQTKIESEQVTTMKTPYFAAKLS